MKKNVECNVFIEALQRCFTRPLPGVSAHLKIARAWRKLSVAAATPESARKAAVLVLLYPKDGDWHFILTERTQNPRDRHSGQMSFPGGGYEPLTDGALPEGMHHCALREAREEIGIDTSVIHTLGQLTELYIPVSNYLVYPYLCWTAAPLTFELQSSEVHTLFEVPLSQLRAPDALKTVDVTLADGTMLPNVPYFDLCNKRVWGATAMILMELLEMIQHY